MVRKLYKMEDDEECYASSYVNLISRRSTLDQITKILSQTKNQSPAVLVSGPIGCGKTEIIREAVRVSTGRPYAPFLTTIQLSADSDAKSLIGSYIQDLKKYMVNEGKNGI